MRKTSLLSLFAMALLASVWMVPSAVAQQGPRHRQADPEQRVERQVRMMDRHLDLSDSQEAQVKELLLAQHAEGRAWLEANENTSREDKRAYRKQQAEAAQSAIASVLTTEQQQKLQENVANRGDKGQFRRGQGRALRGKARRAGFVEKLNLTEAQRTQLKEIRTEQREAAKAWMEANPDATREDKRAYRKQQAEAHREVLESVLTSEQKQTLEDAKSQRNRRDRGAMRQGRRGQHGMAVLDLTDAQKSQLQELKEAHRAEMKAWWEANPNATREEMQAYRKQQAEVQRTGVESVLTTEQKQMLEARKAERQNRRGGKGDAANLKDTGSASLNSSEAENTFALSNYPNPFNPSTEIRFTLPAASHVSLVVYDVQGREVSTLLDEQRSAGEHAATFNAANLPTGTYLYRLTVGSNTQTGRMVLMK